MDIIEKQVPQQNPFANQLDSVDEELRYLYGGNASDIVELPSRGKLYPGDRSHLMVEYMTTSDENILSAPGYIQQGTQLEQLLKRKLVDKSFNVSHLLSGDYEALLLFIRITGLGSNYDVEVADPKTGERFKETIDLSELNLKYLEEEPDAEGLFDFVLPQSKISVKFKLLTIGEVNELGKMIEKTSKNTMNGGYQGFTLELKAQLQKFKHPSKEIWYNIKDNKEAYLVNLFIDKMSPIDALALKNHMKKISPGVDMSWEFVNPMTGNRFRSAVSTDIYFFYPHLRSEAIENEADNADGEIW